MEISNYSLTSDDYNDFEEIFRVLKVPDDFLSDSLDISFNRDNEPIIQQIEKDTNEIMIEMDEKIPSIQDFPNFKKWLLKKIDSIERLI